MIVLFTANIFPIDTLEANSASQAPSHALIESMAPLPLTKHLAQTRGSWTTVGQART